MSTDSHAAHHPHLAHHFKTMDQQFSAAKLGVWLFLATEVLMFGGLFVGYLIFHAKFPEMFAEGATFLDWKLGAFNTIVLLISSFTMAISIHYAQVGKNDKAFWCMAMTLICGFIFLCVKYVEYTHKFEHGLYPGQFFTYEHAHHANLAMYFSFYFVMTGVHGSHVIIGMCLIAWSMFRLKRGDFSPTYYTFIEGTGLFWHLVDLIWIFLFPLLYLVG